jgi:hypothetical protein
MVQFIVDEVVELLELGLAERKRYSLENTGWECVLVKTNEVKYYFYKNER